MPAVAGMGENAATTALQKAGFKVKSIAQNSDTVADKHVISSDPTDFPETSGAVDGRAMLVHATQPIRLDFRSAPKA